MPKAGRTVTTGVATGLEAAAQAANESVAQYCQGATPGGK
jgi:hypothetical protein